MKTVYIVLLPISIFLSACSSNPIQVLSDCTSTTPGQNYSQGLKNYALNGAASQSSTGFWSWNATPDLAIDGNTNGDYMGHSVSHTNSEQNAWWQVDLGDDKKIDKIVLWNRTDNGLARRISNFRVFVTDNNNSITFQRNYCGGNRYFSPAMIINFDKSINGRYVKVMLNGRNYLHLAEVEVFGK
jgi:hypothetical protein